MFAFAIWDSENRSLFTARDRLGIKPFYYAEVELENGEKEFVFASEFTALITHPQIARDLRVDALEDYLALGYLPDPKTILLGVQKLAPGHFMSFDNQAVQVTQNEYWNPADFINGADKRAGNLDDHLGHAVARRMIADVPLGAFLSGGVDSSLIVGVMSDKSEHPVKASTIGSDSAEYDESDAAKSVAKHFNLDHRCQKITGLHANILDELVDYYGEPFADHSALPTYLVSKLAREQVTVSLSGDGADELFGGYRRYSMHLNEEKLRQILPLWIRRPVFGLLARIYPKLDNWPRFLRAKSTFESLSESDAVAYFNSVSKCPDRDRVRLHSAKMIKSLIGYHPSKAFEEIADKVTLNDAFRRVQLIDLMTYLPGDILTKLDRASMACSLEARVPFLDHELVEWSLSQESQTFFDKGKGKQPLKQVLGKLGIARVFDEPKKGFVLPVANLLRSDLKSELLALSDSEILKETGLLDMAAIKKMTCEHLDKKRDHQQILWSLVILEKTLLKIRAL
jgi:asparagine synthase (glutamine-hydrolysing)